MATYHTNIPGLPGGPLETSFPVVIDLLPTWMTRNRPGIKLRGPFETVQHNTANRRTKARAEANYLLNGAGGRQASWHATADDTVVIVTLPVDEVGWQAGDGSGPGNMSCVACELTEQDAMVNNPVTWRRARSNAAEFLAKVAARKGADNKGKKHQDFSGKYCPNRLLGNSTWMREYDQDYAKFHAMERAAMAGGTPADPVIEIGDIVRAVVRLNLRQSATTNAPILTTLPVGHEMTVNGPWTSAFGYGWLPVQTGAGVGFVAQGDANGAYVELAHKAPKPEPPPSYVSAKPIPALLETDLQKYDTAEGITTDDTGNEFIFVADVIEFTLPTVAGEFAVESPRPVKAPYAAGERAIAAWLVKARHGEWFYVLAGEGDEWVRVPYANTIRVSDAPLLGDDTE